MMQFDGINIETLKNLSFSISDGNLVKIITQTDHEKDLLLDLMAGLRKPESGNVSIFEKDIYSRTEPEIIPIYQDIGIVWQKGGLISNLQIWENIALPVEYHTEKTGIECEDEVREILEKLGAPGKGLAAHMTRLPAHLPRHEKTLAGLIKVILMKPRLVIYDSIFNILDLAVGERVTTLAYEFHTAQEKRTSIYLDSNADRLSHIKADMIIKQQTNGWSFSEETPWH